MKPTREYYRNKKGYKINYISGLVKEEIEFLETKNGELSTFSYLHGGIDFSDKRSRLARGLTLNEKDEVVLVGFEKFFLNHQLDLYSNYTEEFKQQFSNINPFNQFDENHQYKLIEKIDGTMVIVGEYKDDLIVSTTSSTTSYHAKIAEKFLRKRQNIKDILRYLKERNTNFVFEYVSPFNKIAVEYKEEDMFLLAEISKETFKQVEILDSFGFKQPKIEYMTMGEIQKTIKESKGIEGFVFENPFGNLIKLKTDWWFEEKEKRSIFFNGKTITKKNIQGVLMSMKDNDIDDLLSYQNSNEELKKEDKVGKIIDVYNKIIDRAEYIALKYHNNIKKIAMSNESKTDKSLAISKITNNLEGEKGERIVLKIMYSKLIK